MFQKDKSLADARTSTGEGPTCARPRVLLADDHRSWLDRVTSLLKSDFDLVGMVGLSVLANCFQVRLAHVNHHFT